MNSCSSGWWFQPLLKNMKVSWDYSSQYMDGKIKKIMFQTTNQSWFKQIHTIQGGDP